MAQTANLFATYKIMRMSIFTRIFGACDLFGKSVSCIPISGSLVGGATQTTMDSVDSAVRFLEHASKRDPSDTALRYITQLATYTVRQRILNAMIKHITFNMKHSFVTA